MPSPHKIYPEKLDVRLTIVQKARIERLRNEYQLNNLGEVIRGLLDGDVKLA